MRSINGFTVLVRCGPVAAIVAGKVYKRESAGRSTRAGTNQPIKRPLSTLEVLKISMQSRDPFDIKTEMLCFFIDPREVPTEIAEEMASRMETAGQGARGAVERFVYRVPESGDILSTSTLGMMPADTILLAGIGSGPHNNSLRFMSGKIALEARRMGLADFAVYVPNVVPGGTAGAISQIVEGAKLSLYSFDRFASEKERESPDMLVVAVDSSTNSDALRRSEIIADEVIFARDVANMPPNICFPSALADIGGSMARRCGLKFCSLAKSDLRNAGFGGISAVGQGSANEPRLIILEYEGGGEKSPTLIVGKAVTFDTGGISIKPSMNMDAMKFDKCGGCAVMAIMSAAARLKLPVNLVGIIPSVENMPGSGSYRPGDIVRLYNGKTVEIINTDAEGRLILADAMAYGEKTYSPAAIIDIATLTEACVVALGTDTAGMVSNNNVMVNRFVMAAQRTAEPVWRLPLVDAHSEMIKSKVADMKNLGSGNAAQTIVAAAFLSNSIGDKPWVHLDIYGPSWTQGTNKVPYNPDGATGFGVRLVLEYISQSPELIAMLEKQQPNWKELEETVHDPLRGRSSR